MPKKITSAEDAFAQATKNKFRAYPTENKQKKRIIPFTTPQIVGRHQIPMDAKFFVAGDCYARNIEKSLQSGSQNVISSPLDIGLPGTHPQQFQRYVIYNLDTIYDEFNWALNDAEDDMDRALVSSGGELADGHVSWVFSHEAETAKKMRKIHNRTFAKVADADVVILVVGGLEQWFDKEAGLYLNGIAPNHWVADYPGRFEHHHMSQQDVYESAKRTCELILSKSKTKPVIFLTGTAGSDAMTYTDGDILNEYMYSRAVQRVAIQQVADEMEQVEYLQSLEYIFMSDRNIGFLPGNHNHINQNVVDRLVADMLLAYQGESAQQSSLAARGLSSTLMSLEDYEGAIKVIEDHMAKDWPKGSYDPDIFTRVLNTAYSRTARKEDHIRLHMRNIIDNPNNEPRDFAPEKSFGIAVNTMMSYKDPELGSELLELGHKLGMNADDIARLTKLLGADADASEAAAQNTAPKEEVQAAGSFDAALEQAQAAMQEGKFTHAIDIVEAHLKDDANARLTDFANVLNLAFTKTGRKDDLVRLHIDYISQNLTGQPKYFPVPKSFTIAINAMASNWSLDLGEQLLALGKDNNFLPAEIERLEKRVEAIRAKVGG